MINPDLAAPTFVVIDTSSGDHEFPVGRTLRGIDVFAPGDLKIADIEGTEITATFPAVADGGTYPTRWTGQIAKVFDTGTDIADDDLVGLR